MSTGFSNRPRVLVTGAAGLLGAALRDLASGSPYVFDFVTRRDGDLEQPGIARALLRQKRPDCIVHAAAVVGGIRYNMDRPEELRDRNRRINEALLEAAFQQEVPKVISFLSSCIFPQDAPEPWGEDLIHRGEPDRLQWGYAQAKRELDRKSQDYIAQSKRRCRFVTLMPTAMYGLNDNYHPERSHVIPAIFLKLQQAKETGVPPIFWGTGRPRREFLYAPDMARVVLWAIEHYEDPQTMIVAPPGDEAVEQAVTWIAEFIGYKGPIRWDTEKPDGRLTRRTDTAKFRRLYPDFEFTPLREGLREVADHFLRVYPRLRGFEPVSAAVEYSHEKR